jgi:hypothetical protein
MLSRRSQSNVVHSIEGGGWYSLIKNKNVTSQDTFTALNYTGNDKLTHVMV